MFRGFRFRLEPTQQQDPLFWQFAGVCRLVCNSAFEQRRDHWRAFKRATGEAITYVTQARERPRNAAQDVTELRADYDWIAAVTQTCEQQALRDRDRTFDNFFTKRAAFPTFRCEGVDAAGLMNAGALGSAAADVGKVGNAVGDASNAGRATADATKVAQGTKDAAKDAADVAKGWEEGRGARQDHSGRAREPLRAKATGGSTEPVASRRPDLVLQGKGLEGAGGGSKVPVPQPPWPVTDLKIQDTLKQSLDETCGQACAAHIAQALGFELVTEGAMIALIGEMATTAMQLAQGLRKLTGKVVAGGATPALVPLSDVSKLVNGLTSQCTKPFSALFYGPNSSLEDGHWVVVEGMKRGRVKIVDPGGVEYRMAASDVHEAWAHQILFFFR